MLCLARAIAQKHKILAIDEATSAIDQETDNLVQKQLKKHFTDSTVLIAAHRLSTLIDCDRILILDDGKLQEY